MFIRRSALCLLVCSVPGFAQTITTAQSQELRAEALSLKNDLTVGNYQLAEQRAVEMNLILNGSPNAKEVHDRVTKMSQEPSWSFHLAPDATTPLLKLADKLIAAIDSGVTADIQLQIKRMIDTVFNTHQTQFKKLAAANVDAKPGTDSLSRSLDLSTALDKALAEGQGSIAKTVSIATELQAVLDERAAQHLWIWGSTKNLYAINEAFGRAALAKGDYVAALAYLKKQTELPDDKQGSLCCFGPTLWLAQQLLNAGYANDVLFFLQGIKPYWIKDAHNRLDGWIAEMEKGATPNMYPNNLIDWGYAQ